jgi:hypothetical protein
MGINDACRDHSRGGQKNEDGPSTQCRPRLVHQLETVEMVDPRSNVHSFDALDFDTKCMRPKLDTKETQLG